MILKKLLCSTLLILTLSNCCGDREIICQKVTSISGQVVDASGNEIMENENIVFNKYSISTNLEFKSTICQNRKKALLESESVTCTAFIPEYRTNLMSIKITSNNDYNLNFPKDIESTNLFKLHVVDANCLDDSTSISNCVSETSTLSNRFIETINLYLQSMENDPSSKYIFVFSLKEAPETTINISFTITWITNDGSGIAYTTNKINITP